MKIDDFEILHCAAAWRNFSFLKIVTDSGVVGWSEYSESFGSQGLTCVIRRMMSAVIGQDPRDVGRISAALFRTTRTAVGGINQQVIAAIEHALLDIKGKALGVPVSDLFGGRFRSRIPLYWSHCGTFRVDYSSDIGYAPIRSQPMHLTPCAQLHEK